MSFFLRSYFTYQIQHEPSPWGLAIGRWPLAHRGLAVAHLIFIKHLPTTRVCYMQLLHLPRQARAICLGPRHRPLAHRGQAVAYLQGAGVERARPQGGAAAQRIQGAVRAEQLQLQP